MDWRLLTTHPVMILEQALQVIRWYSWRWQIEQLFAILKAGCFDIEAPQLESERVIQRYLHPEGDLWMDSAYLLRAAAFEQQIDSGLRQGHRLLFLLSEPPETLPTGPDRAHNLLT